MDFKFTFEDGSEAIAHHGVKGMKWGVRNAETLAKYGLKNANAAGGGGGIALDEDEVTDYQEIIREWSADGESGYSKAAQMIMDRAYGKGNYSKDQLSDAVEMVREWSYDGEKGYAHAAKELATRAAKDKQAKVDSLANKRKKGDFDARDYGFEDNSKESREAALGEAGLNSKMSREAALAKVQADYKKLNQQHPLKNAEAIKRRRKSMEMDLALAKSLPSQANLDRAAGKITKTVDTVNTAKQAGKEAKTLINKKRDRYVKIGRMKVKIGEVPMYNPTSAVVYEVNRVLGKAK